MADGIPGRWLRGKALVAEIGESAEVCLGIDCRASWVTSNIVNSPHGSSVIEA